MKNEEYTDFEKIMKTGIIPKIQYGSYMIVSALILIGIILIIIDNRKLMLIDAILEGIVIVFGGIVIPIFLGKYLEWKIRKYTYY